MQKVEYLRLRNIVNHVVHADGKEATQEYLVNWNRTHTLAEGVDAVETYLARLGETGWELVSSAAYFDPDPYKDQFDHWTDLESWGLFFKRPLP